MDAHLYAAFVAASMLLILMPGPNVALIVANSVAHGVRTGLVTVAGTASAMVIQLALTVLGMETLLAWMGELFDLLRWAGVAYLLYLAIRAFSAPETDLTGTRADARPPLAIWTRGFLVSLTNPKTLLFYGAFLPQFVAPGDDTRSQLVLLAVTFVVLAIVFDSVWALLAGRLARVLTLRARLRNRITAATLALAGLGLALARRT
jgi:homoserine/homoserine lactone efflux protein